MHWQITACYCIVLTISKTDNYPLSELDGQNFGNACDIKNYLLIKGDGMTI